MVRYESSEKLLNALLIPQISKDDYADFHDFSVYFVMEIFIRRLTLSVENLKQGSVWLIK